MKNHYDLIIVGTGPAGLTAAVYAARARIHTLLLEKEFVNGGQIVNTAEVDNYPGMPGITGMNLAEAMKDHAGRLGMISVRESVKEILVDKVNGKKTVVTNKARYESETVILATGARHRMLGVAGEEELAGMGVSYCATCDGAFYRDQTVAVIGGGNTAAEDAILLSRICRKVYVIHRRGELRAEKILQEALLAAENVEICWNTAVTAIEGEDEVSGLRLKDCAADQERFLPVNGVFVAVGVLPNTEAFAGLVRQDEQGYLCAGEDCCTSEAGIYAAGDVRTKELRQIVTAAADGANAVHAAEKYLRERIWGKKN